VADPILASLNAPVVEDPPAYHDPAFVLTFGLSLLFGHFDSGAIHEPAFGLAFAPSLLFASTDLALIGVIVLESRPVDGHRSSVYVCCGSMPGISVRASVRLI